QGHARLAMRGSSNDACSAADLFHDPLEWIVGADLLPVDVREGVVGQRLMDALLDEIGCRVHLAGPQVIDDRSGLLIGRVSALLGMDGLWHMAPPGGRGRRRM